MIKKAPIKEVLPKQKRSSEEKAANSKASVGTRNKLVKSALAHKIMSLLIKKYPEAECELSYKSPFQLLIATILSAQTTDASVNKATGPLFKEYPDAKTLASADIKHLRELVKPTGYYNAKAANIQACAQQLVDQFDGQVPKTQEELVTLRGVGRKTANVVLGVIYGVRGWAVDTHVQRLSKRLGFTKEKDPVKIEKDLEKLLPHEDWSKLSITLIFHGRRTCFAKKPACHLCPVDKLCPSAYKIK